MTPADDAIALPRWLVRLVLPAAAALLVLVFAVGSFPWDRLRQPAARQLEQRIGARVAIERLGPSLGLAGPVLVLHGVRASWPDRQRIELERAAVRAAWTLSWLRGQPGLHLDLRGPLGHARGTLRLGDEPGFEGTISELPLADAPYLDGAGGFALDGLAEVETDLRITGQGPRGALRFRARDGSLAADGLPIALPFATLEGELGFEERGRLELRRIELDGPMLAAHVHGRVDGTRHLEAASLDLVLDLDVRERALIPALASQGVRVGSDGRARLRLRGSARNPRVSEEPP